MNSRKKVILYCFSAISAFFFLYPLFSHAFSVGVTIRGKVLSPPCTINGGRDIFVNFGSGILPGSINGINHEKPLPYTVDCPAGTSNLLKLQVAGTGAAFNASLLSTNKNNLAIEIKSNGTRLAINNWIDFVYPTQPALSAVLVRNSTGSISLGTINATATIIVEYR